MHSLKHNNQTYQPNRNHPLFSDKSSVLDMTILKLTHENTFAKPKTLTYRGTKSAQFYEIETKFEKINRNDPDPPTLANAYKWMHQNIFGLVILNVTFIERLMMLYRSSLFLFVLSKQHPPLKLYRFLSLRYPF